MCCRRHIGMKWIRKTPPVMAVGVTIPKSGNVNNGHPATTKIACSRRHLHPPAAFSPATFRPTAIQGCRCAATLLCGNSLMKFLMHREIYLSDEGACRNATDTTHHRDEFPAGYFLAGCSPASTSPAGSQYAVEVSFRSSIFQLTSKIVLTVCLNRGGKRTDC